jgi:hypothetical protein
MRAPAWRSPFSWPSTERHMHLAVTRVARHRFRPPQYRLRAERELTTASRPRQELRSTPRRSTALWALAVAVVNDITPQPLGAAVLVLALRLPASGAQPDRARLGTTMGGLRDFVVLTGGNSEYGPDQCEVNLGLLEALEAADQADPCKYATREPGPAKRHTGDLHGQAVRRPSRELNAPARLALARGRTGVRA